MKNLLLLCQIILAASIIGLILLQAQGTGLGSTWGGGGETYHTKRGVEKMVFYLTIAAVVLFAVISIAVLTMV